MTQQYSQLGVPSAGRGGHSPHIRRLLGRPVGTAGQNKLALRLLFRPCHGQPAAVAALLQRIASSVTDPDSGLSTREVPSLVGVELRGAGGPAKVS